MRQFDLNEARAAVELLRLSMKITRTALLSWDYPAEARKNLVKFLDGVEADIQEGLTLPPGETERWFKFNFEHYSKALSKLDAQVEAKS